MTTRIGIVQMNTSDDFEHNLSYAKQQVMLAAEQGIDLVAFPETFLYIGDDPQRKHALAQTLAGEIVSQFQRWAVTHNLSMLLGSIYEKAPEDDRLFNTSLLIDRQGVIAAVYRKIHLFDVPDLGHIESAGICPGEELVVTKHEIATLGFTICYDLRFPGLYQALSQQGAEIIFVPSAFFQQTGEHHWLPLLTARAIENQVYIVAPNQWGQHYPGRISYGSSVIIDPWGKVVVCAAQGTGLISAEIDLDYLAQVRRNMPVHSHARPELYNK